MLTAKILRYFKLHLRLCNYICCISFAWDEDRNELGTVKSPVRLRQFKIHLIFAVIHNVFLIANLALCDITSFGIAYQMLAIYFVIGYIMCNGLRLVSYLLEHEIIKLMNAQLEFEGLFKVLKLSTECTKGGERTERILLIMGITTGIAVPLLVFLIIMAHPCLPPFIGSVIFKYNLQEKHCMTYNWWLYFGFGFLNFWMHLDMVLPMVFTMFALFFMSISCLQDYLEVARRNLSFHMLMESRMMIPMQMYRRLQVLEKQLNVCFQHYYFPLFLTGMTALVIFCMHSCIRLPGKVPMPGFSYFPMIVVDGVVSLLVMNTKAANMRDLSCEMIRNWRNNPRVRRNHWMKKMALSFVPLKIQFGSNFVDQLTPLLIVNFSVNQTLSLLMIGSES